jgi:hypothetical protein
MMTMSTALITSRDPKGLHIVGLFEAVLNKAGLDDERAQRLIENGGDFQISLREVVEKHSATNQFADEEVASSYGYFSGYRKPKGITKQTNRLRELFPGIGFADEKLAEQSFPDGAEGWSAIPRWQKIAKTYPEAVQIVLDLIKKACNGKFCNYREGQIDAQHIRQSAKTVEMFHSLGEQQKDYDILVVPCQFGKRHAGRSVRRAREVMMGLQFGLDAFSVGIMLLTHPERLQRYEDLWIDCAGDEFSGGGDSSFDRAPCFYFGDGGVGFVAFDVGFASGGYGSSSAFGPQ